MSTMIAKYKEIKACNGCALRNKDNRPCSDCERAAPCDPGLNDYYTPEPAQDDGQDRESYTDNQDRESYSEDVKEIREALKGILDEYWLMGSEEAKNRIVASKMASLSTIDTEAIRRECADRAEKWFYDTVASQAIIELEGYLMKLRMHQITTLRAAILGTESAQDDGKVCD